ncbi:hypothetical protein MMC10_008480 [Thelotrema lepadinum]|nr:hypothetical protein [Thelotrema lepadinum]
MEKNTAKFYKALGDGSAGSPYVRMSEGYTEPVEAGYPSMSERSFGSDESKYSLLHADKVEKFNAYAAFGIGDDVSVHSNVADNMSQDLNSLFQDTTVPIEPSSEYGHRRQVQVYLDMLAPGLPPDTPLRRQERIIFMRKLLGAISLTRPPTPASNFDFENENNYRPTVWKIVKRILSLQLALVLSVGIITIAKSWGFDLSDFFSYGIFLLVFTVIIAIIAL